MKKFLLFPVLALTLTTSLFGSDPTTQLEPIQVQQAACPEQKMIDEILADYRAGSYNKFLKKSNEEYQKIEKNWGNNDLLEQRKKLSLAAQVHPVEKSADFKREMSALCHTQDQELVEVALSHPKEKISREVRDMVFFSPSKQEEDSIAFLHSLGLKFKGDGASPLENQLIGIDIEFWLKNLSLEIAKAQNKMDDPTFQKQSVVLQIAKIDAMQQACQGVSTDPKITAHIETAAAVFPKVCASAATRRYLLALGEGKQTPKNLAEKELQAVVAKNLKKEEVLVKKFFPAQNSH